jgi:TPR repeat protein
MSNVACVHGSGAACNQLALAQDAGLAIPRDAGEAGRNFARACDAKIPGACFSLVSLVKKDGEGVFGGPCDRGDGESCFVLASLQYAAGAYGPSAALFRRSCEGGWPRANGYFERACRAGIAASCFALGRRQQACDLSLRAVTDNEAYFRAGIQPADPGFCEAR